MSCSTDAPATPARPRLPLVCSDRKLDRERRALALARLEPDATVHPSDQLARDVEAEARAADAARELRVEAVELLEDPLLLGRRHAEPTIANLEADHRVAPAHDHVDCAPVMR